jgi:hypothetical protein
MNDITELILGALAIVLGGAAFAVGGQVIRDAWRGALKRPPVKLPESSATWGRTGAGIAPAAPDPMQAVRVKAGRR